MNITSNGLRLNPVSTNSLDIDPTVKLNSKVKERQSPRLFLDFFQLNHRCNNPLFFSVRSWYFTTHMNLPHWVEQQIAQLPEDFSGKIVVNCWMGGVANLETNSIQQAPKSDVSRRIALTA